MNVEFVVFLVYVRILEDLYVVVGFVIFGFFCGGFCFEDRICEMEFDMFEWFVVEM